MVVNVCKKKKKEKAGIISSSYELYFFPLISPMFGV